MRFFFFFPFSCLEFQRRLTWFLYTAQLALLTRSIHRLVLWNPLQWVQRVVRHARRRNGHYGLDGRARRGQRSGGPRWRKSRQRAGRRYGPRSSRRRHGRRHGRSADAHRRSRVDQAVHCGRCGGSVRTFENVQRRHALAVVANVRIQPASRKRAPATRFLQHRAKEHAIQANCAPLAPPPAPSGLPFASRGLAPPPAPQPPS